MKPEIVFLGLFALLSCQETEYTEPARFETDIEADSVVFAQIGDFGEAGEAESQVAELVESWDPDFIIAAGDINYPNGSFSTLRKNVVPYYGDYIYNFDAPQDLRCNGKAFAEGLNRFFPTPGNHDAYGITGLLPYYMFFTLPGNEYYYNFCWGPVSCFVLNSVHGDLDQQKAWLEKQLAVSERPFNIVLVHHPPYSSGTHGDHAILQWDYHAMGVDVVFSGHDHIYERIEKAGEEGLYYIVNGLGGRATGECGQSVHTSGVQSASCFGDDYGAVKVTASPVKMVVEFYAVGSPDQPVDRFVINP